MVQIGIKIIYFVSLFYLASTVSVELSLDTIYEILSRRIDYVTNNIKSELAETKATMKNIESKIEDIHANVTAAIIGVKKDVERMSESLINDKIKNVEQRSESLITDKIKSMQDISESFIKTKINKKSVAVQKMIYMEKKHMREVIQKFDNKFSTFQSDMKSQMTLMDASLESSIDSLEQSMLKHKTETDTSLVLMSTDLQYMMNETDLVRQDIEDKSKHSLDKIRDVQTTLTGTTSDLQSAKSGIDSRLNNAESRLSSISSKLSGVNYRLSNGESRLSSMSSKLSGVNYRLSNGESRLNSLSSKVTSLEKEQESQEDNFDGQISRLSSRISKEEARKVAFSAMLYTEQSYYGKHERIIFDNVRYSYGGGYSSSTGIFTAPKSGTYLFTFNVQSGNGEDVAIAHVHLMVRGKWITSAIVEVESYTDLTGGNAGIEYLFYGDKAWIETSAYEDKYYIWPYRTTFNGILID